MTLVFATVAYWRLQHTARAEKHNWGLNFKQGKICVPKYWPRVSPSDRERSMNVVPKQHYSGLWLQEPGFDQVFFKTDFAIWA